MLITTADRTRFAATAVRKRRRTCTEKAGFSFLPQYPQGRVGREVNLEEANTLRLTPMGMYWLEICFPRPQVWQIKSAENDRNKSNILKSIGGIDRGRQIVLKGCILIFRPPAS